MAEPIAELKDRLKEAMTMRDKKPSDLVNKLNIPKSAISQYLSGNTKNMDSTRLFSICEYLNVSEGWMMGFDVPMHRPKWEEVTDAVDEKSDVFVDTTTRIGSNEDFREIVKIMLYDLTPEQLASLRNFLNTFIK